MTYEETIKKIDFLIGGYQMLIDGNVANDEKDSYRNLIKVCETAKQALEKQIPKEHHHTRVIAINCDVRESICPSCLGVIATNKEEYPKYCTWCGQRLNWSE